MTINEEKILKKYIKSIIRESLQDMDDYYDSDEGLYVDADDDMGYDDYFVNGGKDKQPTPKEIRQVVFGNKDFDNWFEKYAQRLANARMKERGREAGVDYWRLLHDERVENPEKYYKLYMMNKRMGDDFYSL